MASKASRGAIRGCLPPSPLDSGPSSALHTQMALTFPCRVFNVSWTLNVSPSRSLDITLLLLSRLSSTQGEGCKAICELSPPGYLCVGLQTACSQLGRVGETSRCTLGPTPHCASYDGAGVGVVAGPPRLPVVHTPRRSTEESLHVQLSTLHCFSSTKVNATQ